MVPSAEDTRIDPDFTIFLTAHQAAKLLNFSPKTLESWRTLGKGPPFVRISERTVRYRLVDLVLWSEEHLRRGDG